MFDAQILPAVAAVISLTVQSMQPVSAQVKNHQLAAHSMPMDDRYSNSFVNDVFKDNILLTIAYMRGAIPDKSHITWSDIEKPFHYEFTLQPKEQFAFHDAVLPQYFGKIVQTTNAHFTGLEGFKSDGYLAGDGVCHAASLLYWVASDSGLQALAPVPHDFATIPDIPKKYGVAIYDDPGNASISAQENLYITNTKEKPVTFAFDYKENVLTLTTSESTQ